MKIDDLTGLGRPLTRLIEVVSQGVGAVFQPYLIKRKADASAYEIKAIAGALKDIANEHELPAVYKGQEVEVWQKPDDGTLVLTSDDIQTRSMRRIEYQDRKKQHNIENVIRSAAKELVSETEVADVKPDEDWVTRFFATAQDVSSDEMQVLWGRILAGEVKNPGSYSLRTLDFVRNLTKSEAEIFEKVGRLASTISGIAIIAVHDKKWLEEERSILDSHHFLLGELGLMYPTDLTGRMFVEPSIAKEFIIADDQVLVIERGQITDTVALPIWKFTGIGQELLPLIQKPSDEEYITSIGRFFIRYQGKAALAKIVERHDDGRCRYEVIKAIEPEPNEGAKP